MITWPLRLMASLRANWVDAIHRSLSELSLAEVAMSARLGAAIAIKTADTATTTINSISVNPPKGFLPRIGPEAAWASASDLKSVEAKPLIAVIFG
jgi:hypothetical protein